MIYKQKRVLDHSNVKYLNDDSERVDLPMRMRVR